MIWDCFPFAGEVDVLKCRLETLKCVSGIHHIIVEASVDNHGRPKPLTIFSMLRDSDEWLLQHRHRTSYTTKHELAGPEPWDREKQLRDCVMPLLRFYAKPGDLVLIADVDEVPAPAVLEAPVMEPRTLLMRDIAVTLSRAWPSRQPTSVLVPWPMAQGSLSGMRASRHEFPVTDHAGWHLSWLGGPEAVEKKLAMHCHTRAELDDRISRLRPNDDIPEWCYDNAPASWWADGKPTPRAHVL